MRQLCQSSLCSSLPAFTPAERFWGLPGGLCSHHPQPPVQSRAVGGCPINWSPVAQMAASARFCWGLMVAGICRLYLHTGFVALDAFPPWSPCPWCSCRLGKAQQGVDGRSWHCSSGKGLWVQSVPDPPSWGRRAAALPGLIPPGCFGSGRSAWPHPAAHQEESRAEGEVKLFCPLLKLAPF